MFCENCEDTGARKYLFSYVDHSDAKKEISLILCSSCAKAQKALLQSFGMKDLRVVEKSDSNSR